MSNCLGQSGTFRACPRLGQSATFRACPRLGQIGICRTLLAKSISSFLERNSYPTTENPLPTTHSQPTFPLEQIP